MSHYEILYLIPAQYSEDELTPLKEKVKDLIVKAEGKITLEDSLGKKKLAYPIKHINQGYYLLYEFDLEPAALKKLNDELKLTPEVLRHQIVKKELKAPSMVDITKERIETKEVKKEEKPKKEKIKMEDLDKKLDEILEGDIL